MASPFYNWPDTAQSQFTHSGNSTNEDLYFPCLGVVLDVYSSDAPLNYFSLSSSDSDSKQDELRGSSHVADVYILQDCKFNSWVAKGVVILPGGASGMDNYCEEFPRSSSIVLDGSEMDRTMGSINPLDLDGDMCLVQFIGGNINRGVMTNYFPHFRNVKDPATSGQLGKLLQQVPRFYKRYNGVQFLITPTGNIYIDTNESNATLSLDPDVKKTYKRTPDEEGGFIQIDVKPEQYLEVNLNPTVILKATEPSHPQPNPADSGDPEDRGTDNSRFKLTKDEINLIAGQVLNLLVQDKSGIVLNDKITATSKEEAEIVMDTDITITSKNGAEITLDSDIEVNSVDGSLVKLNGEDYPLPKWAVGTGNFSDDMATFVQDIITVLAAGTAGSPVKQSLIAFTPPVTTDMATFLAKIQSGFYNSTKVKNG